MKKRFSSLIALSLVLAILLSLFTGITVHAEEVQGPLFLDFGTSDTSVGGKVAYNNAAATGRTAAAYDPVDGAAVVTYIKKATTTGDNNGLRVNIGRNGNNALRGIGTKVADYPIIAIKLKLSNKDAVPGNIVAYFDAYKSGTDGIYTGNYDYKNTTDWQIVTINAGGFNRHSADSKYDSFILNLENSSSPYNHEGDTVSIAWLGAFKNEAEALAFDGDSPLHIDFNKPGVAANVRDAETKTKFISDNNTGNVTVSYDAAEDATKITVDSLGTNAREIRVEIGNPIENAIFDNENVRCQDYSVIAMRVKLSNPNITANGYMISALNSKEDEKGGVINYAPTTEWQTVYLKLSNISDLSDGVWRRFFLHLADKDSLNVGDSIYIKWFAVTPASNSSVEHFAEGCGFKVDYNNAAAAANTVLPKTNTKFISDATNGTVNVSYVPEDEATKVTLTALSSGTTSLRTEIGGIGGGNKFASQSLFNYKIDAKKYPFIALRVKMNNINFAAGNGSTYVSDSDGNFKEIGIGVVIKKTTEWQTVIIDATKFNLTEENKYFYTGALIRFFNNNGTSVGAGYEIKSLMFFDTAENAAKAFDISPAVNHITSDKLGIFQNRDDYECGLTASYDENLSAARVTRTSLGNNPSSQNNRMRTQLDLENFSTATVKEPSADDYPVFAAMIKLGNANIKAGVNWGLVSKNTDTNNNTVYFSPTYSATDDWQLVFYDASTNASYNNNSSGYNWKTVRMFLSDYNSTANCLGTEDASVYVKWTGFFKDTADAYSYAGKFIDNNYIVDAGTSAPSLFNNGNSNNTIAYNAAEKATQITLGEDVVDNPNASKNNGIRINFGVGGTSNFQTVKPVRISERPVVAIRLKLTNENAVSGNFVAYGTKSSKEGKEAASTFTYEKTTDWQTVYLDYTPALSAGKTLTADDLYRGMILNFEFIGSAANAKGDSVYVRYLGFFKNKAEADEYFAKAETELTNATGLITDSYDEDFGNYFDGGVVDYGFGSYHSYITYLRSEEYARSLHLNANNIVFAVKGNISENEYDYADMYTSIIKAYISRYNNVYVGTAPYDTKRYTYTMASAQKAVAESLGLETVDAYSFTKAKPELFEEDGYPASYDVTKTLSADGYAALAQLVSDTVNNGEQSYTVNLALPQGAAAVDVSVDGRLYAENVQNVSVKLFKGIATVVLTDTDTLARKVYFVEDGVATAIDELATDSASVSLKADYPIGLNFESKINPDIFESGDYTVSKVGTILTQLENCLEGELLIETRDRHIDAVYYDGDEIDFFGDNKATADTYSSSITGFTSSYYLADFIGRGYIVLTDTNGHFHYVYDNAVTANVGELAYNFFNESNDEFNELSDLAKSKLCPAIEAYAASIQAATPSFGIYTVTPDMYLSANYIEPAYSAGYLTADKSAPTGDANNDKKVNLLDLIRTKKYLADDTVEINCYAADINKTAEVDALDLPLLKQILLG